MLYLICYDIAKPDRLRKTAKIMEDYGLRIQRSFFQCSMEEKKLHEMLVKIKKVIERRRDSFFVYPLCEDCSRNAETDGNGDLLRLEGYVIL
jgi:CRISPR-associated protein Cas2